MFQFSKCTILYPLFTFVIVTIFCVRPYVPSFLSLWPWNARICDLFLGDLLTTIIPSTFRKMLVYGGLYSLWAIDWAVFLQQQQQLNNTSFIRCSSIPTTFFNFDNSGIEINIPFTNLLHNLGNSVEQLELHWVYRSGKTRDFAYLDP